MSNTVTSKKDDNQAEWLPYDDSIVMMWDERTGSARLDHYFMIVQLGNNKECKIRVLARWRIQLRDGVNVCVNTTMAGVDVDTLTMEQYLALSRENQAPGVGPIPGMRPAQALTSIQTMADHSQKWHDGTTSRKIGSSSSNDGLAALVGCQICEVPHLDKDCPLNEEVKQVEEVRMENLDEQRLLMGIMGESFMKEKSEQAKVVIVEQEGPSSPKKLKNLRGISFLSDSQEENTIDQLPM
ncbi:hypothetical protein Tco_0577001 [Tanacetum coccineum]